MNEHLRDRILRRLESLSDERGYQVLDFVEFLESRYAERQAPGTTPFTRFAEAVEDRLRAGKISASTIAEAMNMMNRAANVLNGALAAGRSVANDIVSATRASGQAGGSTAPGTATPAAGSTAQTAASGGARPSHMASGRETPPPVETDEPANGATATEASLPAHDTPLPDSGEEKL